jgi:divinyl protochlorophyllide a 8-vinyl-reductase
VSAVSAAASGAGRIGPNAITRVAEALPAVVGSGATWLLFERAGLVAYLRQPPERMVDEREAARLHAELRASLGLEQARCVALAAGRATADYLLAHRIPQGVQRLLRVLPAGLSARVLTRAIARHAWTFAGSGHFSARAPLPAEAARGTRLVYEIRDNPLVRGVEAARPLCGFYEATFEQLLRVLVRSGAQVEETACEACGDDCCRFELRW